MSKKRGKTVKFTSSGPISARWIDRDQSVEFKVPELEYTIVISDYDLERMIDSDSYESFLFVTEQGELDDETYELVSWIQSQYYVTKNIFRVLKHAWVSNNRYPAWTELKRRVPRGGRKKGYHYSSPEEIDRIKFLIENYDSIVSECVKKDWFEEYINMNMDIAKYRGERVSKRALREKFVELRKELSL